MQAISGKANIMTSSHLGCFHTALRFCSRAPSAAAESDVLVSGLSSEVRCRALSISCSSRASTLSLGSLTEACAAGLSGSTGLMLVPCTPALSASAPAPCNMTL